MAIDWGLARTPNFFEALQGGYQAGRAQGKQDRADHGYARYAAGDPGGIADVMSVDPQAGIALRADQKSQDDQRYSDQAAAALAHGDNQGALDAYSHLGAEQYVALQSHIASLSVAQRAQAQAANDKLAGILHGIAATTKDPNERLRIAQHMAGLHPEFGIDPNALTLDDVSDSGIDAHVKSAMSVAEILAQEKPVEVRPGASLINPTDAAHPLYVAPEKLPQGLRHNAETGEVEVDPTYVALHGQLANNAAAAVAAHRKPAAGHKAAAGPSAPAVNPSALWR